MKVKLLLVIFGLCIALSVMIILITTPKEKIPDPEDVSMVDTVRIEEDMPFLPVDPKPVHYLSDSLGLVNIQDMDSTIGVDLKYATTDNFTGTVLYEDMDAAYFQPEVAVMLAKAHQLLKELRPDLRLLIYDATRPLSVQQIMWEQVKDTPYHRYIASPDRHGLHNYGAAVDLTLADSLFRPLDMGSPFDHFGKTAGINHEEEMIAEGLLTRQQVQDRQLLRNVMRQAGFRSISGEWWHFNACSLSEAKQRYRLIE